MITKISFENFKGFPRYEIDFTRLNLLVGGNNSGKTTIFHALQLIFWCIEQTVDVSETHATFRKTQVPQIGALPYFNHRDLFFRQQVQQGRAPVRIRLSIETDSTPPLRFSIYRAFSRNLMIDGSDQRVHRQEYERLLGMKPVYIAGAVGITVQEEYLRVVSQQRLIAEGKQNQVLRNLVYRLHESGEWKAFTELVSPLFALDGMDVPFDLMKDEWLSATYTEEDCQFDLVSAGSGFLQTINLLCFLFLNESRTVLLDEPDSHMHDDLQRLVFSALDGLSSRRNLQLIIATHSPTLVDAAGLDSVRLVDRKNPKPLIAQNVDTLLPLLADQGLSLPPNKVLETLRSRKALFVEGLEADYDAFVAALGEVHQTGFAASTRGLSVFEMGGAQRRWPFDAIACFERLLGAKLDYVYLADRDFLTDDELAARHSQATKQGKKLLHLERRHRESYLLDPTVIARVLEARWIRRNDGKVLPEGLTVEGLRRFILEKARDLEDKTRADLLVEHEPILRGDANHRSAGISHLNEYFRVAYTTPLAAGEIPYKLLDAKIVLRDLRCQIVEQHGISFSDLELCREFTAAELPHELKNLSDALLEMFSRPIPKRRSAPPPSQVENPAPEHAPDGRTESPGTNRPLVGKQSVAPAISTRKSAKGRTGEASKGARGGRRIAPLPDPAVPRGTVPSAKALEGLNPNESEILRVLASAAGELHLGELAAKAFSKLRDDVKANSWARNSVRKPIQKGLVTKVGSGMYRITSSGKKLVGNQQGKS
jgi:ABC-type cobalamin/Fe3+-siderophores transport system ATPase subunit